MADPRDEPFGDVLRRLRLSAGLSQDALARRAGSSERGISDLERGRGVCPGRRRSRCWPTRWGWTQAARSELVHAGRQPPAAPTANPAGVAVSAVAQCRTTSRWD